MCDAALCAPCASAVAMSTWGAISSARPFLLAWNSLGESCSDKLELQWFVSVISDHRI